jgi:hypothetical protein
MRVNRKRLTSIRACHFVYQSKRRCKLTVKLMKVIVLCMRVSCYSQQNERPAMKKKMSHVFQLFPFFAGSRIHNGK